MSLKKPLLAVATVFTPSLIAGGCIAHHNDQVAKISRLTSEALSASPAGTYVAAEHPDLENLRIQEGHGLGPNNGVSVLKFDIPGATCEVRLDPNVPASRLTLQRLESVGAQQAEPFCIS